MFISPTFSADSSISNLLEPLSNIAVCLNSRNVNKNIYLALKFKKAAKSRFG